MVNDELINRKIELIVENNETDNNPKYYHDENNVLRRFHACCIVTDEYSATEKTIILGKEIKRKSKKVVRSAVMLDNDYQMEAELKRLGKWETRKIFVERIDKITEYINNLHREKSQLSLKGMQCIVPDKYHPSSWSTFEIKLPSNESINCYSVYNTPNGLDARYEGHTTPMDLFQKILKLNKKIPLNQVMPSVYYETKDLYDILGEKQDAKTARRERISADLYKPVEYLRKAPSKLKKAIDIPAVGMNNLRNKLSIKRLLVYASVLTVLVVGGAKGFRKYQLQSSPNGYDFLMFDERFGTGKDQDLQIQRDTYSPKARELADSKKTGLTLDEIEKTKKYLTDVVNTGVDHNASFNMINLPDLVSENWENIDEYRLQEKQRILAEKILNKYKDCFYRPGDNNIVEVNNDKGKVFLDFAIPLQIFSEDYLSKPYSFTSYASSNRNSPTTEDIKLYAGMPDVLKAVVNAEINAVRRNVIGYSFIHPTVTPTGNPSTFDIKKAMDHAVRKVNARLLAQASDVVVEEEERARAQGNK